MFVFNPLNVRIMFLEFVIGFTFRSFLDTHLRPEDRVLVLGDVDLI